MKKEELKKEEVTTEETTQTKMSYEELEKIAHNLFNQNREMAKRLQELETNNIFVRLNYLFKVIENSHAFDTKFMSDCIQEIKELMTIKVEEENTKDDE